MKRAILVLTCFAAMLCSACGSNDDNKSTAGGSTDGGGKKDTTVVANTYVRGADISWYTEMAADGKKFYNAQGAERACPALIKECGMTAVRLRVWVNPQNKHCNFSDAADVAAKAKAAKESGLKVMVDFHFSDWWADPSRQETPADWASCTKAELMQKVKDHVTTTLNLVKATGADVAWVQIGNETRNGMMHPTGQLWNDKGDIADGWTNFVALYNQGYAAAKSVLPNALVMPHVDNAYDDNDWWFKKFKAAGGRMDAIALSHYPQTNDNLTWQQMNTQAAQHVSQLYATYNVPVIVAEFGVKIADETLAAQVTTDFIGRLNTIYQKTPKAVGGIFYWEPEVYGDWKPASYNEFGWGSYNMGAFTAKGRPSSVITEFVK